jgi:hypothetical protein
MASIRGAMSASASILATSSGVVVSHHSNPNFD